jgi:putative ABC transport system permease protein
LCLEVFNHPITFVAVLTLALGIGANTAIFSVVNAVLLAKLPAKDPNRLVQLWETESSPGKFPLTGADYLDWESQNHTLEGSALYRYVSPANGSHNGQSQSVLVLRTEATYFSVLGANALLGRVFTRGDDQPESRHIAVLSYGFWQESFAGREDVVNTTLDLDNEKYTVVGVMPSWFRVPAEAQVFVPLDMMLKAVGTRGNHGYKAIGRLKPNVTASMAQADLNIIAARLEKQFPDTNNDVSATVVPLSVKKFWVMSGKDCCSFWPRLGQCCCWHAPTWPIFFWPGRPAVRKKSHCAQCLAPAGCV